MPPIECKQQIVYEAIVPDLTVEEEKKMPQVKVEAKEQLKKNNPKVEPQVRKDLDAKLVQDEDEDETKPKFDSIL